MNWNKFKNSIFALILVFCCYGLHYFVFKYFNIHLNQQALNLGLFDLYVLFSSFSVLIIIILLFIKQKNIDLVGNVFMLITCIKAIICYVIIRPLTISKIDYSLEKFNFLGLFLLFLIFETIATIKILNNKI